MLKALFLSFESLSDRRVQALMAKVVLLTFAVFAVLGVALWFALDWAIGWTGLGYHDGLLTTLAAGALTSFSMLLLFRIVAVAITWVFSDDIIDAVEDKHYPAHAMMGKRPGLAKGVLMGIRSVARVIGYNLLALPLYAILLFTGIGLPIAFLFVNALLLGRDLEDMLIARHGKAHGQISRLPRFGLGLAGTAAMLVPIVNLFVPVIATAMAVHMVHGDARKA